MSRRFPFWFTATAVSLALVACQATHSEPIDGPTDEVDAPRPQGQAEATATEVAATTEEGTTRSGPRGKVTEDVLRGASDGDDGAIVVATPASTTGTASVGSPPPVGDKSKPVARPDPSKEPMAARREYAVGGVTTAGPSTGASGFVGMPAPLSPPPPPLVRDAEQYTDYGVNGFALVADDPLSTFVVDVDTASYAMTRRKLTEGYLPPTSSVRVEEFVNYFPYEYKHPKPGDPFAVDFEATTSPWNPRNVIVRVGVQGQKVSYDQRKPVHLTFLVDVSGSMRSDDKIELLKKSFKMLTAELDDGDTVAIATYAGSTSIVLEPTPISRRGDIEAALSRLMAGGSTSMGAGIELAYGLADRTFVPGDVNRVIIASDGDANVGTTSHETLSQYIRRYAEKGITLTTLGFGAGNYKDTMMEQLANDGDGNYFYIDSESEARRVLVDKMTSTLEVIAKDVKIQVDWNPGAVIAYRLIGYENRDVADVDFRNDKVDAGEIGSGHQVTALYEVSLRDAPTGNLAVVRLRNKAPGPDSPAVERSYAMPVSALKTSFAEGSDQFRIAVAAGTFAEILRDSPYVGEVRLRDVEAVARAAARPEYDEDAELVTLIDRAATLRGEGGMVRR